MTELAELTAENKETLSLLESLGINVPDDAEWTGAQWDEADAWAKEAAKAADDNMHDPNVVANPPSILADLVPVPAGRLFDPGPERDDDANGRLAEPMKFRVQFKRASVGKTTTRLGLSMPSGSMSTQAARDLLCERRLTVSIRNGTDQLQLQGDGFDEQSEIEGVADTRALSIKTKEFSTGLTFSNNEVDPISLMPFVETDGTLTISAVTEIPKPEPTPKKSKQGGRAAPPRAEPIADADWGQEPVIDLQGFTFDREGKEKRLSETLCESVTNSLIKAGKSGGRIRDLRDWINENQYWWRDVKGLGEKKIDDVTDALIAYQEANPIAPSNEEEEDDVDNSESPDGETAAE